MRMWQEADFVSSVSCNQFDHMTKERESGREMERRRKERARDRVDIPFVRVCACV